MGKKRILAVFCSPFSSPSCPVKSRYHTKEKQNTANAFSLLLFQVDGLVMVDMESSDSEKACLKPNTDCRDFISDCVCRVCRKRHEIGDKKMLALFEDYCYISPTELDQLSNHQYLLCPYQIPAFIFKTREWGKGRLGPPTSLLIELSY